MRVFAYLWASPNSALGLLAALLALASGARTSIREGVLQVSGGRLASWLQHTPVKAVAITLGHVVLAIDDHHMELTWDHEMGHVRQCEVWGPLFLPAYGIASLIAKQQGRHYYVDNWFERDAESFRERCEAAARSHPGS